ncbi:M4 family metallopeptidase [Mycolicibacterium sp. XJ647]
MRSITNARKDIEYHAIGTEAVPIIDSTVVKFAQYRQQIPVYGSLVTIELDDKNNMVAMNSALGNPDNVDPVATISPAAAKDVVIKDAGKEALPLTDAPELYFYYDTSADPSLWRLVYIYENVERQSQPTAEHTEAVPEIFDYVVDAHSSELVAKLQRMKSMVWTAEEIDSTDGLGRTRRIRVERDASGNKRLTDPGRRVETYDFEFRGVRCDRRLLPGTGPVANPPAPWDPAAISAHANAQAVADYFLNTLKRDGLDNAGGRFVSSVNCTWMGGAISREWPNAAWIGPANQIVYGQHSVKGRLRSFAVAKDIVAHEITHGLTEKTARLVYQDESGALDESYSDIFGVLVANADRSNIDDWDWQIGGELEDSGRPLRDLSNPARCRQPTHMDEFVDTTDDDGGVHANSGIHNKAAFNVISARNGQGYLFTPQEAGALFYVALIAHLSNTSGFRDSRRAVELAAKSLFRHKALNEKEVKLSAIRTAFDEVGISA